MIRFENVWKSYQIRNFEKIVLRDLSFEVPDRASLGICGANGAGKSTLMRLIAGVEQPSAGRISRNLSCSWPIGYSSCFQATLTGADNTRFISRIYGQDEHEVLRYVEEFAQLGPYLHQPLFTYSAGMSARLAFGVSLAVDFDCYLVDEVTGAGDERFRAKCEGALQHRRANGTLIMISHDFGTLERYCDRGAVLYEGQLTFYDTVGEAIERHQENQRQPA
jgi:capsular polysaccharide transport system ATP-binding protein